MHPGSAKQRRFQHLPRCAAFSVALVSFSRPYTLFKAWGDVRSRRRCDTPRGLRSIFSFLPELSLLLLPRRKRDTTHAPNSAPATSKLHHRAGAVASVFAERPGDSTTFLHHYLESISARPSCNKYPTAWMPTHLLSRTTSLILASSVASASVHLMAVEPGTCSCTYRTTTEFLRFLSQEPGQLLS